MIFLKGAQMKKEVIIGVIGALIGALVIFLGGSAFGLYTKTMTDSQIQEVSRLIVDEGKYREVLLAKMEASKKFIGSQGLQGIPGNKGEKGSKGDSIWPNGSYGIFAYGKCPKGFTKKTASLHAIKFYMNTKDYITPSSLGNSRISIHNNGNSGAQANLDLVVCLK
jgi:hypothetical protein